MRNSRPELYTAWHPTVALVLGVLISYTSAQIPIAVMDFEGYGISQTEVIALTNRLRNELFRIGQFDVVERGMMESILAEQDFQLTGCTSDECLVEIGQLLGAEQMVGGSVSRVGETFTVSARRVNVQTGSVLAVSDYDLQGALDELLTSGMRVVAYRLAGLSYPEEVEETPQLPLAGAIAEILADSPAQSSVSLPTIRQRGFQAVLGAYSSQEEGETLTIFSLSYLWDENNWLDWRSLHPAITVGYDVYAGQFDTTIYIEDWGGRRLYAMLEAHKKWAWQKTSFDIFMGLGLAYSNHWRSYSDVSQEPPEEAYDLTGFGAAVSFGFEFSLKTAGWPIIVLQLRSTADTVHQGGGAAFGVGLRL
jgi:TolB-like protein